MSDALQFFLPVADDVRELLTGLLGRKVTVAHSTSIDLRSAVPRFYGVYRDVAQRTTCLCVLDMPLAASLGGALTAIPVSAVNEAIKTGSIGEGLRDSVIEVFNVCSQVFNHGANHRVFCQLCVNQGELPQDGKSVLACPAGRLDLEASITAYGSGHLTFLIGKPSEVVSMARDTSTVAG